MSWYSDRERFDEKPDPPYCRNCKSTAFSKEACDRCIQRHEEDEAEAKGEDEE